MANKKNQNKNLAQMKCTYFEFSYFIKDKFAEEIISIIILIVIIIMIKISGFFSANKLMLHTVFMVIAFMYTVLTTETSCRH